MERSRLGWRFLIRIDSCRSVPCLTYTLTAIVEAESKRALRVDSSIGREADLELATSLFSAGLAADGQAIVAATILERLAGVLIAGFEAAANHFHECLDFPECLASATTLASVKIHASPTFLERATNHALPRCHCRRHEPGRCHFRPAAAKPLACSVPVDNHWRRSS